MQKIEQAIQYYILAWNCTDSVARVSIMAKVLAENCVYVDSHLP